MIINYNIFNMAENKIFNSHYQFRYSIENEAGKIIDTLCAGNIIFTIFTKIKINNINSASNWYRSIIE